MTIEKQHNYLLQMIPAPLSTSSSTFGFVLSCLFVFFFFFVCLFLSYLFRIIMLCSRYLSNLTKKILFCLNDRRNLSGMYVCMYSYVFKIVCQRNFALCIIAHYREILCNFVCFLKMFNKLLFKNLFFFYVVVVVAFLK